MYRYSPGLFSIIAQEHAQQLLGESCSLGGQVQDSTITRKSVRVSSDGLVPVETETKVASVV